MDSTPMEDALHALMIYVTCVALMPSPALAALMAMAHQGDRVSHVLILSA